MTNIRKDKESQETQPFEPTGVEVKVGFGLDGDLRFFNDIDKFSAKSNVSVENMDFEPIAIAEIDVGTQIENIVTSSFGSQVAYVAILCKRKFMIYYVFEGGCCE